MAKVRALRRRYRTLWLSGPNRAPMHGAVNKHVVLCVEEAGHDEHNCWMEYLIARWK